MGSLRFFSHRATLAAPPSKVAAAAAEAAKAAPLLLLLLLPVLLAVVRVQDVYEADPVFRAAAALRVETAISRPFKYWKYLGRCIGVLDERKTMHMRSRCGRAPLLIFGLDIFGRLTATASDSTSCVGSRKRTPRVVHRDMQGNSTQSMSYAFVQSTKGHTRTHDIAGQPPDPLNTSSNLFQICDLCHLSYLTGGKPSSENGSHAHGCMITKQGCCIQELMLLVFFLA